LNGSVLVGQQSRWYAAVAAAESAYGLASPWLVCNSRGPPESPLQVSERRPLPPTAPIAHRCSEAFVNGMDALHSEGVTGSTEAYCSVQAWTLVPSESGFVNPQPMMSEAL
jgi:hypothetical protein